jgi:hypothetical protein
VPGRRGLIVAGGLTALVAAACTAHVSGRGQGSSTPAASCPAGYARPDPNRPRVTLDFSVAADHATVAGSERVVFTPDLPIDELVFRLTANTVPTVVAGNKIVVTSARADHGAGSATYTSAGADSSSQGGLLHIPFGRRLVAGTTVTADLAFTVTLGKESFDRFGRTGGFAWFASAQPLLAWEHGFGWHTEPMLRFAAESATSEAMQTDLTVTAPAADTVVMSGDPVAGISSSRGTRRWHSTIGAARDVSVAVGPFHVTDAVVGAVRLRVAAYDGANAAALLPQFESAIAQLAARFGPFPFSSLSVARLPATGGGIEYPSSILMLNGGRLVAVHETAHQWFYAMVGDSQARHAWLDEAFASYAEQLVDDDAPPPAVVNEPGPVDRPTADYGDNAAGYFRITYDKGAAALHAARAAAGAPRFDAAIRCYVNANAWRIAEPADLQTALRGLPAALKVLRGAGALP